MAASSAAGRPPLGFDALGPVQFIPPKGFDGKTANFEEFSFKLKVYLYLMDPGYEKALKAVEDYPDRDIKDADFIDSEGREKPALIKQAGQLQWILVTLCAGSASAVLRRESTPMGVA